MTVVMPTTIERSYKDEHNHVEFIIVFPPNHTFANIITSATHYRDPKNRNPDIALSYQYKHIFAFNKKLSTLPLVHSFTELAFKQYHQSAHNKIKTNRDLALTITGLPETVDDYILTSRLVTNWIKSLQILDYVDYPYIVEVRDIKTAALTDVNPTLKLDYYLNHGAKVIKEYLLLLEKNLNIFNSEETVGNKQTIVKNNFSL